MIVNLPGESTFVVTDRQFMLYRDEWASEKLGSQDRGWQPNFFVCLIVKYHYITRIFLYLNGLRQALALLRPSPYAGRYIKLIKQ